MRPFLAKLFLWYAVLHYSYIWLMNHNPYAEQANVVSDDVLAFLILKNAAWAAVLALVITRWDAERRTLVIHGVLPKAHAGWVLLTTVCMLVAAFVKDPLSLLIAVINLLAFSFAPILAGPLLPRAEAVWSYTRMLRWIAWLVLGIGIYQKLTGFVGPHFGRIISTLGGPELLSLFAVFLLGHFLFQFRHAQKTSDTVLALVGIGLVAVIQLFAVTLAGQLLMVLYLLLCVCTLRGRAVWLLVLAVCLLAAGAISSPLFQDTIDKLDGITGGLDHYGRLNEHEMFWSYALQKAEWYELLIGVEKEDTKFENQYYFVAYNYGFIVLLSFLLLLLNALFHGIRAWRRVAAKGSRMHSDFAFIHLSYFALILVGSAITPYLASFPINFFAWMSLGIALRLRDLSASDERSSA
jgi:hypothetical protein